MAVLALKLQETHAFMFDICKEKCDIVIAIYTNNKNYIYLGIKTE